MISPYVEFSILFKNSFPFDMYEETDHVDLTEKKDIWGRISVKDESSEPVSLRGVNGHMRFRSFGTANLEIHFPYEDKIAEKALVIKNVVDAVRIHKSLSINILKTNIFDVGQEGLWYTVKLSTNYVYDEVL